VCKGDIVVVVSLVGIVVSLVGAKTKASVVDDNAAAAVQKYAYAYVDGRRLLIMIMLL